MSELEVVAKQIHTNGSAAPFTLAVVDDPEDGDTKLVVMFEQPGHIAVLSLDRLLEEDISLKTNSFRGDRYEPRLRQLFYE